MDQIKSGKFIAQIRKEKELTQTQLADKLFISNKTVSKWETGKGMPEVSLMLPLCEVLGISVNELLAGERIPEENYKEKAEETMMNLMRDKKGKKKIVVLLVLVLTMMLIPLIMIAVVGTDISGNKATVCGILYGAMMIVGAITILYVDCSIGYYECSECGEKFVPSLGKYAAAFNHSPTGHKMKCPKCGESSWCSHNLY